MYKILTEEDANATASSSNNAQQAQDNTSSQPNNTNQNQDKSNDASNNNDEATKNQISTLLSAKAECERRKHEAQNVYNNETKMALSKYNDTVKKENMAIDQINGQLAKLNANFSTGNSNESAKTPFKYSYRLYESLNDGGLTRIMTELLISVFNKVSPSYTPDEIKEKKTYEGWAKRLIAEINLYDRKESHINEIDEAFKNLLENKQAPKYTDGEINRIIAAFDEEIRGNEAFSWIAESDK